MLECRRPEPRSVQENGHVLHHRRRRRSHSDRRVFRSAL